MAILGGVDDRDVVAVNAGPTMGINVISGCGKAILVGISIVDTVITAVNCELIIIAAVEEVNKVGYAWFRVDSEVNDAFLGFLAHISQRGRGRGGNGGSVWVAQTFIPLVHIALSGFDWQQMTFLCTANCLSPQRILRSQKSPAFRKLRDRLAVCITVDDEQY